MSATGWRVTAAHAPFAHSEESIGAIAVNVDRPSGSTPAGATGESSTTRSVRSGCVRAYWLATNVPYDVP